MDDVAIFSQELYAASASLHTATSELLTENANVVGEDTGIENPGYRASLRLEMHRRLSGLHDRVLLRSDEAARLASSVSSIADRYSDLDIELTGQEQT